MRGSISFMALAALACAAVPITSRADDVATLRAELDALKADYVSRVALLETRIAELESSAAQGASAPGPATDSSLTPGRAGATAFNPAMSLILGGTYAHLSEDPAGYRVAGFVPAGDEIGPGERSFNLGESELTLSANVDPYFSGSLTVAMTAQDELEVEEAFVRTLALPAGLSLKAGRLLSGFGYLNEVHAHAWDFVDQPLAYQAFFGGQRRQDGLQLRWVAPTDVFIELGAETGNGDAFPGTRRGSNGLNGATLFAHVGSDIGDAFAWRGGVSMVDLRAKDRTYEDTDALGVSIVNSFTGSSRTWVADLTLKWTAQGDPMRRHLKLQGEFMRRTEDGDLAFDVAGRALGDRYRSTQDGWYVQGVYQFRPRWRAGVRYDALDSGVPEIGLVESGALSPADFPLLAPADPSRTSVMLDWSPSEFSRLRAQYAWDDARGLATDEQLYLQYIHALGAHGAHKF